jgi:hypothetical protein
MDLVRHEEDQEKTKSKKKPPPPPDDLEYWLPRLDWEQDSTEIEKQGYFGPVGVDEFHGTIDNIKEDLKKHAVWDGSYLDRIGAELQELEGLLQQYKELYFGTDPKRTYVMEREGLSQLPKAFLTELEERQDTMIERMLEHERRLRSLGNEQLFDGNACKNVKNQLWPSEIQGSYLPALPNQVDSVFIVDKVSKLEEDQGQRVWKKACYCKGTLKMLQGTFWWFWMEKFRPNKEMQSKIFDILSEKFVFMILDLSLDDSDKFVLHYPRCLAQAVFCAFLEAYPLSVKEFNSEFRKDLANLTSMWITGYKVTQNSWNKWPILSTLPMLSASEVNAEQKKAVKQMADAHLALQHIQKELDEGHVKFKGLARGQKSLSKGTKHSQPQDIDDESYQVGVIGFERIRVGVFSLSPLVDRFLVIHQLTKEDHYLGVGLKRTEIASLPYP